MFASFNSIENQRRVGDLWLLFRWVSARSKPCYNVPLIFVVPLPSAMPHRKKYEQTVQAPQITTANVIWMQEYFHPNEAPFFFCSKVNRLENCVRFVFDSFYSVSLVRFFSCVMKCPLWWINTKCKHHWMAAGRRKESNQRTQNQWIECPGEAIPPDNWFTKIHPIALWDNSLHCVRIMFI